jgi:hypothetical protein
MRPASWKAIKSARHQSYTTADCVWRFVILVCLFLAPTVSTFRFATLLVTWGKLSHAANRRHERPDRADVGAKIFGVKSERRGKRDLEVSAIENILESFATAALGLELKDRIRDLSSLPHSLNVSDTSDRSPTAWAAWHTDRGVVTLRALYDEVQSQRVRAHVVRIAWWIGTEHHDGWWHSYAKFPRDWIKGIGRI